MRFFCFMYTAQVISAEAPVFFTLACELLIREMAIRGHAEAVLHNRRTVLVRAPLR